MGGFFTPTGVGTLIEKGKEKRIIDGKEMLRQEIMDAVNARLPEYQVIYVYFTDFVVE